MKIAIDSTYLYSYFYRTFSKRANCGNAKNNPVENNEQSRNN
ncbi:MAG: hypothetical protein AVDCRST_MAG96-469 [uncultured Segetibacter sp.]|uniref:Uncharacterized protein n=1 Tax=uncultured Segetibacter sp. TaxID=481133 RepID=A0A6J4RGD4_9BACT|nr:MAG: hypothetical protein AVDCRST_MAG96-469 [uncultured Segetibacter sp.]